MADAFIIDACRHAPAELARQAKAPSPTFIPSTSDRPSSAPCATATASRPQTSTTSYGAPAPKCRSSPVTWVA